MGFFDYSILDVSFFRFGGFSLDAPRRTLLKRPTWGWWKYFIQE
jgi:hypothetical protein